MASDVAERIATDVIDGARARAVHTGTGQKMPTHAELISIIRKVLEEYYVMPKQAGEGLEAGVAFIREQQAAEIARLRAVIDALNDENSRFWCALRRAEDRGELDTEARDMMRPIAAAKREAEKAALEGGDAS